MGRLHDIIDAHLRAQPYPVSQRKLAQRLGVSPSTIENWRQPRDLVAKEHLVRIARVTERSYDEVLQALLFDIGYLYESQQPLPTARSRRRRRDLAEAGEALREAGARLAPPSEAPIKADRTTLTQPARDTEDTA